MTATPKIIALRREVEDPTTGATVRVHKVRVYSVDLVAKVTNASLAGFVSEAAFRADKAPITHTAVRVPGLPGPDPELWIYQQFVAAAEDERNPLAAAEPVFEVEG